MERFELLGDERAININITNEGVIMDAFQNDQLVGTVGMTFEEWFNYVEGR